MPTQKWVKSITPMKRSRDAEKRAQYDLMLDNPYMGQGFGGGMGNGQGFNANMSQTDLDEILRQFGGGAGGRQSQSTGGFRFDDIFSTFGAGQAGFQTDLVADSRNARPKATISTPSCQLI